MSKAPGRVPRRSRVAFTPFERLVVIGLIAIPIGLLLPAAQPIRKASHRLRITTKHVRQGNKGAWPP